MVDAVDLSVEAAFGDVQLWLVGDDADRARFARRPVKRALRAGKAFDARHVVDVDVERSADRRDRLLVEIGPDLRQRSRVIAFGVGPAGRRDAAHVNGRLSRLRGQERHRRQLLRIILEIGDVQLVEAARTERDHVDGDVLDILFALLRGDDDFGLVRNNAFLCMLNAPRRRCDISGVGARRWGLAGRLRLCVLSPGRCGYGG